MKMKKISIIILIITIVAFVGILWRNYSRRVLDLDMDMCDENGNVIHVKVDAILHRKPGKSWKFEGEVRYGDKVFTSWKYDPSWRFVPVGLETSERMDSFYEWLNGFLVADRKDGTYYFMTYQQKGGSDAINYFEPASTKEEAERIEEIWSEVFHGDGDAF